MTAHNLYHTLNKQNLIYIIVYILYYSCKHTHYRRQPLQMFYVWKSNFYFFWSLFSTVRSVYGTLRFIVLLALCHTHLTVVCDKHNSVQRYDDVESSETLCRLLHILLSVIHFIITIICLKS